VAFDFHDYAFAPLLIATAILAIDRRRWSVFWPAAIALLFVKEDLIPLLIVLGIYLWLQGERRRGVTLAVLSTVAFAVVVDLVIPSLSESGAFIYTSTYEGVWREPWSIVERLVTPVTKVRTAALWVAPFLLLPLFSPLTVLLVPFVLSRFLSDSPTHWGTTFHYAAPLAPIVAMAAADGLARLGRRCNLHERAATAVCVGCVLVSAIVPGQQPIWDLFEREHYTLRPHHLVGRTVIAAIPDTASVVAQSALLPHLSRRRDLHLLDASAPDADWVIASEHVDPWPLRDFAEVRSLLQQRIERGYRIAVEANGWICLQRLRP
jgi:uncharacterized membrane protein